MRRFRDQRLDEIERLYRERFTHFVAVARAVTHDEDAAVDAVQEAFANVVRSRRSFRGDGPLEAWVWRAVVNAALRARKRPDPEPAGDRSNGRRPDEPLGIAALVAALPERQRLAIFLRYYADLDYRAIARALDVEIGTVSATLSQAHASLRRALQEVPR